MAYKTRIFPIASQPAELFLPRKREEIDCISQTTSSKTQTFEIVSFDIKKITIKIIFSLFSLIYLSIFHLV